MNRQSGGIGAAALILVLTLAVVGASAVSLLQATQGALSGDAFAAAVEQNPAALAALLGGPMLLGLVAALVVGAAGRPAAPGARVADDGQPATPAPPSTDAALRLLALLQQEGRFVDFLLEDIEPYDDNQVGAAVRSIHAGCRAVLEERLQLERIVEGADGATIEVPAGFDAAAIRVTGNVAGAPPFRGTLQHNGWRAVKITIPEAAGDPRILAPAEVEVP